MQATADPTMDFIQRLNDPSKWVVRRGVPLFKAHARKGRDGEEVKVTSYDLAEIATNTAELERKHGVAGRITPGHVRADLAEEQQPALYGFFRNPRVGKFGPRGEPAVLVDCYYFPEHAAKADRLPYRSAEYYPSEKAIRGMALLTRDPFLDLGVVTYTGVGRAYQYAMEADVADEPNPTGPKPAAAPAPDPKEGQNEDVTPDEMALFDKCFKYFTMKGYMGAPAAPAPAPVPAPGGPPVPMNKDKNPELYELKATVDKQATEIATLKQKNNESDVELLVGQLAAERYQFDRDFEKATLLKLTPQERQAYLKNLRARYQRVPEGEVVVYAGTVEGGDEPPAAALARDQLDEALAYQNEHKCNWGTARAAILTKKK